MDKFKSITTQGIKHDAANLLTEILLLNKYGDLEPYCWRKNHSMAKEWPKSLALIRKLIKSFDIKPEQIAWFFYKTRPKEINSKEFGLVAWQIRRLFPQMPLGKIHGIYLAKFKPEPSSYFSLKEQSKPTETGKTRQKSNLLDVLSQLENKGGE